jgi:hypothetical protein
MLRQQGLRDWTCGTEKGISNHVSHLFPANGQYENMKNVIYGTTGASTPRFWFRLHGLMLVLQALVHSVISVGENSPQGSVTGLDSSCRQLIVRVFHNVDIQTDGDASDCRQGLILYYEDLREAYTLRNLTLAFDLYSRNPDPCHTMGGTCNLHALARAGLQQRIFSCKTSDHFIMTHVKKTAVRLKSGELVQCDKDSIQTRLRAQGGPLSYAEVYIVRDDVQCAMPQNGIKPGTNQTMCVCGKDGYPASLSGGECDTFV